MLSLFDVQDLDGSLQEQLRLHTERYHRYGLTENPFPLGGNYPEAYLPYTYYDNEKEQKIRDFLISTFVREEFNGLLVLGGYGSGKSHVLHFMKEVINSEPFFGKKAQCFLIQNPSVAPEDILLSMLREMKLSVVQDMIFRQVSASLQEQYGTSYLNFLRDFTNFSPQIPIDGEAYSPPSSQNLFTLTYREFLKHLVDRNLKINHRYLQNFARDVLSQRLSAVADVLINDLVQLIAAEDTMKSWESFLASRLLRSKSSLGVEYYLQAFLELFKASGIRHVYLLVDEVEDLRTQRINAKATVEYLATLRKMIQHNYRMFSLVLACTRDAWADLRQLYTAIEDRFPLTLDLASSQAEIKHVVLRYLAQAQLDDINLENVWSPFTENGVDAVIAGRGLVLRHVLTALRSVLDEAARQEIGPPIDETFVQKTLAQIL